MSDVAVRLSGLCRSFSEGEDNRTVLDGINLEVKPSEFVALVGPSGCGKTTLLSIIGALDHGFEGAAEVLGRDLTKLNDDQRSVLRARDIGFVFQAFHLLEHLSAVENVELACWLLDEGPADPRKAAHEALERVGLGSRADARIPILSGGERQRVAVARALITKPKLLLADEPTGNLDAETGRGIMDLFENVRTESECAVVVATHDPALTERAGRAIRLSEGRLASS